MKKQIYTFSYPHELDSSIYKILHMIELLLLNAILDLLVCAHVDPRQHMAENNIGQEGDMEIVGISWPFPS